jgi:hypothetical protein
MREPDDAPLGRIEIELPPFGTAQFPRPDEGKGRELQGRAGHGIALVAADARFSGV